MNAISVSGYYLVSVTLLLWLFLWRVVRAERRAPGVKLGLGLAALGVCLVPINGLPLWRSIFAIWGNPSVPLVALAGASLVERWRGVALLTSRERLVLWSFGAGMGTLLYFHLHLPGGLDLYSRGWDRSLFALALVIATVLLLGRGQRLGVICFLVLAASTLGVLESSNAWDYLIDPFFWLVGVGVTIKAAVTWLRRGRPSPAQPESESPGNSRA